MVLSIKDVEDNQLARSEMTTRFVGFVHKFGERIQDFDEDTIKSVCTMFPI